LLTLSNSETLIHSFSIPLKNFWREKQVWHCSVVFKINSLVTFDAKLFACFDGSNNSNNLSLNSNENQQQTNHNRIISFQIYSKKLDILDFSTISNNNSSNQQQQQQQQQQLQQNQIQNQQNQFQLQTNQSNSKVKPFAPISQFSKPINLLFSMNSNSPIKTLNEFLSFFLKKSKWYCENEIETKHKT